MIEKRPDSLLADPAYSILPKLPISLDWSSIPELIRGATLDLGGIQPITKAMVDAAGGPLHDKPSEGEVALFQRRGTSFQLISVVLSCVPAGEIDGVLQVKPFAMTLIPASKRGNVQETTIDLVAKLDVDAWLATEPMYAGYDPFLGGWSLSGNLPGYMDGERKGYLDEMGFVVDQFFLATELADDDDVLMMDVQMPSEEMKSRYERHRRKLFFAPFKKVEARRVWGAETPIELFLIQGLAKENLFPQSQMLIMEDGGIFPAWYHLWNDPKFRTTTGLVTEADLYFPAQRIAIFCDGSSHARKKNRERDTAINAKLEAMEITAIRIPGSEIKFELAKAVSRVKNALESI